MTQPEQTTALARRYAVDINLGTTPAPDWQRLRAMREFTPHNEPNNEDDGVYDDEGWAGNVRTGLQWQAEAVISHRYDNTTGQFDPVHRFLRNSSIKFGSNSYVGVRYYDIGGPDRAPDPDDAWEGRALVDWAPEGGEQTNLDRVALTMLGHGKLEEIANPAGPAQDPVVLSTDPTSGPEAGGNQVEVFGAWFVDVVDVEFGASSADSFVVVNQSRIVAVAPSGTGAANEVVVTTAAGTSSDGPTYEYV